MNDDQSSEAISLRDAPLVYGSLAFGPGCIAPLFGLTSASVAWPTGPATIVAPGVAAGIVLPE